MYPSFMDEDMVDAADTLDSSFFSKASAVPCWPPEVGRGPAAPAWGLDVERGSDGDPRVGASPCWEQGHQLCPALQSPGLCDAPWEWQGATPPSWACFMP